MVSGLYDVVVGILLLFSQPFVVSLFRIPPPNYPLTGNLNGLFLLAVGFGYGWPARDPVTYRFYLWLMGVFLKGAGAILFVYDVAWRGSPTAFLLFALTDGSLALATFILLHTNRPSRFEQ